MQILRILSSVSVLIFSPDGLFGFAKYTNWIFS